jgi:hypothetical protein
MEINRTLQRLRGRWEENIEMDTGEKHASWNLLISKLDS